MQEEEGKEENSEEGCEEKFVKDLDPRSLALNIKEIHEHVKEGIEYHVGQIPDDCPPAHLRVLLNNSAIVHQGISVGLNTIIENVKPREVH